MNSTRLNSRSTNCALKKQGLKITKQSLRLVISFFWQNENLFNHLMTSRNKKEILKKCSKGLTSKFSKKGKYFILVQENKTNNIELN